jgi:hypothetical protein
VVPLIPDTRLDDIEARAWPPGHTLPAMPPSQPDMPSQNVGMDMQSVLEQLHSRDALRAAILGVSCTLHE